MLRFKLKSLYDTKIQRGPRVHLAQCSPTGDPRAYFRWSPTIRFHCSHLKFNARKRSRVYNIKVVCDPTEVLYVNRSVEKRSGNTEVTMETFVGDLRPSARLPTYLLSSPLHHSCRVGFWDCNGYLHTGFDGRSFSRQNRTATNDRRMDAVEKSRPFGGGGGDVVDGHEHGRRAGKVVESPANRQNVGNTFGRIVGTTVGRIGGRRRRQRRHDVEPTAVRRRR